MTRVITVARIGGDYVACDARDGGGRIMSVRIQNGLVTMGAGEDAPIVLGYVKAFHELGAAVRENYPGDRITFEPADYGLIPDERKLIRSLNNYPTGGSGISHPRG